MHVPARSRLIALALGSAALATLALCVGTLSSSCAVEGFVVVDGVGGNGAGPALGGGGAGGSGVGANPTSGGAPGCGHATWPPPPAASDGGEDDVDVVLAVRTLDFGEKDLARGPKIGFDLDSRCTCAGDGPSCKAPEFVTEDGCDGPDGIDNATASIFEAGAVFSSEITSEVQSERADTGVWTLLVRVKGYNGMPNDDNVSVHLHPSPGVDDDACNPDGFEPLWDGNDRWSVAATSLVEPAAGGAGGAGGGGMGGAGGEGGCESVSADGYDIEQPAYFDDMAYVSDGQLVANIPQGVLSLSSSSRTTDIAFTAAFLVGSLSLDAGRWSLSGGTLAGRFRVVDLFQSLSTLISDGEPVCTDANIYQLIKTAVCSYPEIASQLGGPTTPCDAISFGLAFEAEQAQFGTIVDVPASVADCPEDTDPAGDSCDAE